MSAYVDLQDLSAGNLARLNDMLRYLFQKVQGGITREELSEELAEDIDTVDGDKLEDGAVTAEKIGDEAIASYHVQDAAITNAKIDRATVDKLVVTSADIEDANINSLSAGIINTQNITVQGEGERLQISKNLIRINDGDHDRVLLGDVNKDESIYGLKILARNGTSVLFNETGITADGIPDKTIEYKKLDEYLKNQIDFMAGASAVFYQPSEPTGGIYNIGDVWFKTSDGYKVFQWDGKAWVAAPENSAAFSVGRLMTKLLFAGIITADMVQTGTLHSNYTLTGSLTVGDPEAAHMAIAPVLNSGSKEYELHTYNVDNGNKQYKVNSLTKQGLFVRNSNIVQHTSIGKGRTGIGIFARADRQEENHG